jgi:hypothetical protein
MIGTGAFVRSEQDRLAPQQLLVLTGAGCLMLLLIGWTRPISDVDMLWQVKLGQLMLERHGLVDQDPFTFTHSGEAFPPVCWLAQVVYAGLHSLGGWRLLQGIDNLLFIGALLIGGLSVRQVRARAVAAALVIGFLVALPHNSLRPQTFALVGFALLLALRSAPLPAWVRIGLGGVLLLAWQNLHPSLVIAGVALAALAAGEVWEWLRGRQSEDLGVTVALLVLAALCQFATPMGAHLFAVSARNADLSLRPPQPAMEWLPCWDPRVRQVALGSTGLGLVVAFALLVLRRFRVKAGDLLLCLVMSALAVYALRFGLFWAVALVPILARWADPVLPGEKKEQAAVPPVPVYLPPLATVALIAAALVPVAVRPQEFAGDIPFTALRKLKQAVPTGRIYNFPPYGGPLIWEGYPEWRVLNDGRIYIFSDEEWKEYYDAADGKVAVDALVAHYSPDAFFLQSYVQRGLIEKLEQHPRWERLYKDDVCQVFVLKQPTSTVALR